ncbi:MAG: hypothetical protein FVQ85_17035 [Planctomycetes bacterium]|nr:hypothetical protein [Planctomycetota bacterium]
MKYFSYSTFLFFTVGFVVSVVRLFVYQHKLMRYLLKNHTEKWKELTSILDFGPGYANSIRGMKFLFGKEYLGDPEVLRLKVIVRNSFLFAIMGAVMVFLSFALAVAFSPK